MQSTTLALMLVGLASSAVALGADAPPSPPFTQAIAVGGTYYISGTLGIDPATKVVPANTDTEAHMVLDAVKKSLADGGLGMDDLVSVTVYCTDLSLYDAFNAVYRSYFHGKFPTRAFIGVNQLVRGAHFEIQAIATTHAGKT